MLIQWLEALKLNQQQVDAVTYQSGPLFVIAGAGTGKTKTLTTKIAYLIREIGIPSDHILAVTFTNKAASEIRKRVDELVKPSQMGSWLHTFHSFGLRLLRLHADDLGLGYQLNFNVIDEDDVQKIIRELVKSQEIDSKKYTVRSLRNAISSKKNDHEPLEDVYQNIYQAYQTYLRSNQLMDFDDLIIYTLKLLESRADILEHYQRRFEYILVDEFQDTDKMQYKIVKLLASRHQQVFVVGDPDQSIYAFRGAHYGNSKYFIDDFKAHQIVLDQNYRSTNYILNGANRLIQHNHHKPLEKILKSDFGLGHPVSYFRGDNDYQETYYVINEIQNLIRKGYEYEDIVVLYRNNSLSRLFEDAMIRSSIPYMIYGGTSFYERKEIKDMLAYVRLLVNPELNFYLKRVINEPKRSIGLASIEKLEQYATLNQLSMFEAIDTIEISATKHMRQFKNMIEEMREKLNTVNELKEVVGMVLNDSGYRDMLQIEKDDISKDRMDNIFELSSVFASADRFYQGTILERLIQLLDQIALYTDLDKKSASDNLVKLSTIHQVKGLEFKVVFMVALEEGIFPSDRVFLDPLDLYEERRVCYVGMTRAKERLYMTHAQQRMLYGNIKYQYPSRFIKESKEQETTQTVMQKAYHEAVETKHQGYLSKGDKIIHDVFGSGIVISVSEEIATIAFVAPHGIKKLIEHHPAIKKVK